jgi:hypothetical protein
MPAAARFLALALAALLLPIAAACAGDDDNGDGNGGPAGEATAGDNGDDPIVDRGTPGRSDGGDDLTPGPDSPTLSLGDATAAASQTARVEMRITGFPEPGLGAWTLDIQYDPAIATPTGCEPREGSVCNPEFREDLVRIAGAVAEGLVGDTALGTVTFTCDAAGTTPLDVLIDVLADGTIGGPQPVAANIDAGQLVCT